MNLDRWLGDARFESSGEFDLSLDQGLEKVARFQFSDPHLSPLAMVVAAVRGGARSIRVETQDRQVHYLLDMPEPDLDSFQGLVWAVAACRSTVTEIALQCPMQARQLILTPTGYRHKEYAGADCGAVSVRIRRQGTAPEQLILPLHCSLCPIAIDLNSQRVQVNLGKAHSGRRYFWSATVPELLRPPRTATLATPLAVFGCRSKNPNPRWVAVAGGVSYPFLLPELPGLAGIVWCNELQTDLGLQKLVTDLRWDQMKADLLEAFAP